jgi:hypothetical protein
MLCGMILGVSPTPVISLDLVGVKLRTEIPVPRSSTTPAIGSQTKAIVCTVGDKANCHLPEARAFDHQDKDLDVTEKTILINNDGVASWEKSKQINFSLRSEWCIEYTASDMSGNEAEAVHFMVILKDRNAPVIREVDIPKSLEAAEKRFTPPKATAVDDYDGPVPVKFFPSRVDLSTVGSKSVTYISHDHAGVFGKGGKDNVAKRTYNIQVGDTTAPVMKLNAGSKFQECGATITDPGASCVDALDGKLKVHTSTTRAVMSSRVTNVIAYSCQDTAGMTTRKQRVVAVRDTKAPILSIGDHHTMQYLADSKRRPTNTHHAIARLLRSDSVKCSDACDSNPTVEVSLYKGNCGGEFSCYNKHGMQARCSGGAGHKLPFDGTDRSYLPPGTFGIKYTCTDASKNLIAKCRTLYSIAQHGADSVPVINVKGNDVMRVEGARSRLYTDAGATCSDEKLGDLTSTISISGFVDLTTIGSYRMVYNCRAPDGRIAKQAVRRVVVVDTTAPTCKLNGKLVVQDEATFEFHDPGAKCVDNMDNKLRVSITGRVDIRVPGKYVVTYSATDVSGNYGHVKRIVVVKDTLKPVIALDYAGKTFRVSSGGKGNPANKHFKVKKALIEEGGATDASRAMIPAALAIITIGSALMVIRAMHAVEMQ